MISKKTGVILFLIILILFVGTRVAGLHISYQQDESKLPYFADKTQHLPGGIPHPPLMELLFNNAGTVLGADNYRIIPFTLGFINIFLLFYLAKIMFNIRTALWAIFLFTVVYFSLISSLMLGVDGEFMPLFFLIAGIAYYKLRLKNFALKETWPYLIIFIFGIVGGVLTKVSAVLPIGAFALDFGIEKNVFKDIRKTMKYLLFGLITLIVLGGILYLSKFVFTFFDIDKALTYWKHFSNSSSFLDRGWLQTFIQFWKCILYASPLLILTPFFIDKEIWEKTKPLFFFLGIGVIFYLFVFDFSLGAIDMYLQFSVVPLCIISAAVFAKHIGNKGDESDKQKNKITFQIIGAILIFFLQFLPHIIPPLYPKILWLSRVISLKWNFLFPFTGGSGPVPFYVSFLFIAMSWMICILFVLYSLKRPAAKKIAIISILIFGLTYNVILMEEYLFGRINGSTQTLIDNAVVHIKSNNKIKEVLVYNDNGGFEIRQIGKYKRRIYAVPAYEKYYKEIFEGFSGNILFIDIPKLSEDSFYKKFFDTCTVVYNESNGKILSKIYDCSIKKLQ